MQGMYHRLFWGGSPNYVEIKKSILITEKEGWEMGHCKSIQDGNEISKFRQFRGESERQRERETNVVSITQVSDNSLPV